jgi:hypothetical protein
VARALVERLSPSKPDDDGRPAVILYAGDLDPSGADFPRDLAARLDGVRVEHIALRR